MPPACMLNGGRRKSDFFRNQESTIWQFKAPQVSERNPLDDFPFLFSSMPSSTNFFSSCSLPPPSQGDLFFYHLSPTPCPPSREVEEKEGEGETVGMYETGDQVKLKLLTGISRDFYFFCTVTAQDPRASPVKSRNHLLANPPTYYYKYVYIILDCQSHCLA